jgi:hypothetical protein
MKLTLRKANALQLLINEQLSATNVPVSVNVGKYDEPIKAVIAAAGIHTAALNKKKELLAVLYSIRVKVATVSHNAGVGDILSEVAHIDKLSEVLKPLATTTQFAPSEEVLLAAHEDLKKDQPNVNSYGARRDAFTTGIVPVGWIPGYATEVKELRLRKQSLSDKLLELNIKNEIELTANEEEILKKHDVI